MTEENTVATERVAVDAFTKREINDLREHPRETDGDVVKRALAALKRANQMNSGRK